MDRPIDAMLREQSATTGQKASKLVSLELARTLGELAMSDLSLSRNMVLNPNILRRIDENHLCELFFHQDLERGLGGRVHP